MIDYRWVAPLGGEIAMATQAQTSVGTPVHLWVVGILSLLWNAYGAFDYTMTELGNQAYLTSMGLGEEDIAYIAALPAWTVAIWAVGVWGSLVGAVLLLLRSRFAAPAFLVSLAGAVASFVYQYAAEAPTSFTSGIAALIPAAIVILIAAQWYYARRMSAAGVLR
jgi:hypothetical protein